MPFASNGLSVSRRDGLVTRAAEDDLLVLDSSSNEVTCLTGPAAQVWLALEARTTIAALEAETQLSEAAVAGAIGELSTAGLVELGGFDRRRFLQRSALVGAGAVGSVVVMQLPAAASVVTGGGTSGPYDLGTILNTAIGSQPATAGATTPYSFSYVIPPSNAGATETTYTVGSFVADGYYASTSSKKKPRFNDTGDGNDNASVGAYSAGGFTGGQTDSAVVQVNKQASSATEYRLADAVIQFTSPIAGSLSASIAFTGGLSTTSVQLVNALGTVEQKYTGTALATTAYTSPTAITSGGAYYVIVSDTSTAEPTMFLQLSISVTGA